MKKNIYGVGEGEKLPWQMDEKELLAKHLAHQMTANIKMLSVMKRGVFILDALGKSRQTHDLLWLRSKMVEMIKKHNPEHYGETL